MAHNHLIKDGGLLQYDIYMTRIFSLEKLSPRKKSPSKSIGTKFKETLSPGSGTFREIINKGRTFGKRFPMENR